jgi:hypothetical protein
MGWGTLDRTAYIEALKALAALAPDTTFRTDHVWTSRHGALSIMMIGGTHEGGAFEEPRVTVSEHDGRGAYRRIDWYGLAQLDEARARFAALRPDPLRIPPNAASRVRDRMRRTAALGDWSAFRALAQADFTFDDRTRRSLVTGDLELFLENAVFVALQPGARVTSELIGTAGDRIALEHHVATGGGVGGGVRERVPQSGGGRRGRPARGHDLLGRRRSPRRVCRSERALPRRGGGRERRTG